MRKQLLTLSSVALLALTSCGGVGKNTSSSSSSQSSNPDSSKTVEPGSSPSSESQPSSSSEAKPDTSAHTDPSEESSEHYGPEESSTEPHEDSSAEPHEDSSTEPGGDSSQGSDSSTSEEEYGWSAEAKAIMAEHLYGVILPYNYLEETNVFYYEDDDQVVLYGGEFSSDDLAYYAEAEFGSEWVGGAVEGEDIPENSYFTYETSVDTLEGTRYVVYQFAIVDEEGYISETGEGTFFGIASDPYYYEFPSLAIADFFEAYEGDAFEVPAIPGASAYEFYEDDYNELYLEYGYESWINATVVAYDQTEESFLAYADILEEAGFVVEIDEDEIYAEIEVENGTQSLTVTYYADYEAIAAVIYAYAFQPAEWPAADIAEVLGEDNNIPAWEDESINEYELYGSAASGKLQVVCYTDGSADLDELLSDYEDLLVDSGWAFSDTDSYGYNYFTNADESITLGPWTYPDSDAVILDIEFEPVFEAAPWPTELVDSIVGEGNEIPALESDSIYEWDSYTKDGFLELLGYSNGDETELAEIVNDYCEALVDAGWTFSYYDDYDDPHFVNEDGTIDICPWYSTYYGGVLIDIKFYVEHEAAPWPAEDIAEILGAENGLPALETEDIYEYAVSTRSNGLRITGTVAGSASSTELVAEYCDLLEDAGWTLAYEDSSGDPHYVNADNTLDVCPWAGSSSLYIDVDFIVPAVWPEDDIEAFYGDDAPELPALENSKISEFEAYNDEESSMQIVAYVRSSDAEEYEAIIADYIEVLEAEGWEYDRTDNYKYDHYTDGEFDLFIWYNATKGYIVIELTPYVEYEPGVWDASLIEAFFEKWEGDAFEVPELVGAADYEFGEDSNNELYYYFGMDEYINAYYYAWGTDADDLDDYVEVLEDAGWTVNYDADGDYYFATKAFEDGIASIEVAYNDEYEVIIISFFAYMSEPEIAEWPAEEIAAFFEAYEEEGAVAFEVPAIEGASSYEFAEDQNNDYYVALGYPEYINASVTVAGIDAEDYEAYLDALTEAGWEVVIDEEGFYAIKEIDGALACIQGGYDEGEFLLRIFAVPEQPPLTEWPAEQVAEYLGDKVTDVLPAFEDGEEYRFQTDAFGTYVNALLDEEADADEAVADYQAQLVEAGFKVEGQTYGYDTYVSPNRQFAVVVYAYNGYIVVDFVAVPQKIEWPAEALEEFLPEGINLPEFDVEGAAAVNTSSIDTVFSIAVSMPGTDDDLLSLVADYQDALIEAGWKFDHVDADEDNWYISADGQVQICVYVFNGKIYFELEKEPETLTSFPTDKIEEAFPGAGDLIPAMEDDSIVGYEFNDLSEDGVVVIGVIVEGEEVDLEAIIDAYNLQLEASNWQLFDENGPHEKLYMSEDGKFLIIAYVNEGNLYINIIDLSSM